MTPFAEWLNVSFESFDHTVLEFFHELALAASPILTPLANALGFMGELSWFTVVIALVLLLFSKTRKGGVAMIFSVLIGMVFTNIFIKNIVARPRPYVMGYEDWWTFVGAPTPSEYSFPSGHATAVVATLLALCLFLCLDAKKHRWIIAPASVYTFLMCAARNYLMVHYPTDIVGGVITGALAALLGYFLASLLCKKVFIAHVTNKFCRFMLDADIRNLFKNKQEA